jgi:hypothetical protein
MRIKSRKRFYSGYGKAVFQVQTRFIQLSYSTAAIHALARKPEPRAAQTVLLFKKSTAKCRNIQATINRL